MLTTASGPAGRFLDAFRRSAILAPVRSIGMSGRPPKVVYWNHSPTPYFVERYNAVADRGNVRLEAWFNTRREAMRSWDVDESRWRFPARYIPTRRLGGLRAQVPVPELIRTRPDLLVQEYDRGHLTLGFLAGAHLAGRSAFRVLPNYDSWSDRTWWREAGKRFVFAAVDGAKVPGPDGAALAQRYGLPAARTVRVTQSIDVARLSGARAADERERVRAELGLAGCTFIYVGRLWRGKGLDDLLDAYAGLGPGASLLIVGDGEDEQRYRARARGLPRVAFAGFAQGAGLASLYGAADAMVFPTLGDPHGLVVEEAMAAGLPVICSSAAGDIALRLPHGEAGYVVAPSAPGELRERMAALAADRHLRERMGARARELALSRDHTRYAEDFEAFVEHVLTGAARTGAAARAARTAGGVLCRALRGRPCAELLSPTHHEGKGGRVPRMREVGSRPEAELWTEVSR
jgi:glycosyltransferase involved in cell wall biosynthesis